MDSSSTVRCASDQRGGRRATAFPAREYRRERQHLYPFDDYEAALTAGGTVWSYCGIEATLLPSTASDIVEVDEPEPDDCVTCVDLWRGHDLVRL